MERSMVHNPNGKNRNLTRACMHELQQKQPERKEGSVKMRGQNERETRGRVIYPEAHVAWIIFRRPLMREVPC